MVGVTRPHRAEVPLVERGHFLLPKLFASDHDRRIHHSQVQVSIFRLEIGHAPHFCDRELLQTIRAFRNVREKDRPHLGLQSFANPVVDLHQGRRYDDERFVDLFQNIHTTSMRRIVRVQNRQDGARIENE